MRQLPLPPTLCGFCELKLIAGMLGIYAGYQSLYDTVAAK
jgi:hypothetical protein